MPSLEATEINRLRERYYNACVTQVRRLHDDLMILRVRPDNPLAFEPGQYTVLGLGYWERRVANVEDETLASRQFRQLVQRAYSISCRMLDGEGRLVRAPDDGELEFYVALIRTSKLRPPALTPRLFALAEEDRIFMGQHAHGHYTLSSVQPNDQVIFAATGTGEAPHNAMLAELLARGHPGRIASITCVRRKEDLGYLAAHRRLETMFAGYRYVALTTREPENLDPVRPDYVGKQYLQTFVESGAFTSKSGIQLEPRQTHVFLCGNPAMIGVPRHTRDPAQRYPSPVGMVEVLERLGFQADEPHHPGNVHFEKYW